MAEPRHPHVATVEPAAFGESPFTSPTVDATLRVSVLVVGRRSLAAQRRGRYVAGSGAHPARMAPDLTGALIAAYTAPGDWVLHPFAGIGTTHVEAIHLGRHACGVEIDLGWVALARANIALARRQGGAGPGRIIIADATRLPCGIPSAPPSASLAAGRRRSDARYWGSRRPAEPGWWPDDGESRYHPAPLRSRRPLKASHKTTEADDHHDQHEDPGTRRPGSPAGRTR